MNILVTGGSGVLGRWVCYELLNDKHTVISFDRTTNVGNIEEFIENDRFLHVRGNILNPTDLIDVFIKNDIDMCIHLAAKVSVQESIDYPEKYIETNIIGTTNVLDCAITRQKERPKFVYCSTCAIYDSLVEASEISPFITPKSPYSASKLAGEHLCTSYHFAYGLPVTIIRPFNIYGIYDMKSVIAKFMISHLKGETLKIFGSGRQTRTFVNVKDVARFFKMVVARSRTHDVLWRFPHVFNIGTERDISINDLASIIERDVFKIEHVDHPHLQSEIMRSACNYEKARVLYGWESTISLEEGLKEYENWLRGVLEVD